MTLTARFAMAAMPAMLVCIAGESVSTPFLALLFDGSKAQFHRLLGSPGAAALDSGFRGGGSYSHVAVSSERQYALAVSASDGSVHLLDLRNGAPAGYEVSQPADTIVLSPSEDAAVAWRGSQLQVITGLPEAPHVSAAVSTTPMGGTIARAAVSDGGSSLLIAVGSDVWLLEDGRFTRWLQDAAGAIAFAPGARAAFALTKAGEILRRDPSGAVAKLAAVDSARDVLAMQLSRDEQRLWLISSDGLISRLNIADASWSSVSCACNPTGLHATRVPGWFRITDPGSAPVLMVDASGTAPRVWFVPGVYEPETGESGQ